MHDFLYLKKLSLFILLGLLGLVIGLLSYLSKPQITDVAIIGGGISGIYAAYRLSHDVNQNNSIDLFEGSSRLGGVFYLISDSGNELAYQWLKTILGKNIRLHACDNLYSGVNLDTTISLLRPGLALINPSRVNDNNLPEPLKKWEIIKAPEMIEVNYSDIQPTASVWLGMNLLMLRPDLAVVDADQIPLIKMLDKKGINVLPLKLRHGRILGGGFHCITLDVRRKGELLDYF